VIAIFAGQLLEPVRPTIFGDGEQTRDFVYVDDVVDAFVRATDRGDGLILNIGTSVETSVQDLFETMARLVGFDEPARYAMARPGELQRSALDPARAANHLEWKPWTALEDGLRRTIDWFRTVPVGSRR
jgi:UDP-glucose 4-epimerase